MAILLSLGCSVNVKKDGEGQDKKVDIQTPVAGLHVSSNPDVEDTGLPVYPGATRKPKKEGDSEETGANLNIATSFFGLKVVAVEFLSQDSPDKVMAYYKDKLSKYGKVLECHKRKGGGSVSMNSRDGDDSKDRELKCEGDNTGNVIELKVGTQEKQRIVSIEPKEKGTDFALVFVQTRGKDTI
ncbi:MAG TPA: hypothetical protein VFA68_04620 [Terriglobales bacterium]|nr:hypothetical protein [Terriglobales bacterium]